MEEIQRHFIEYFKKIEERELTKHEDQINSLILFCRDVGIELHKNNFKYADKSGLRVHYDNILSLIYPELKSNKDGLFDIQDLFNEFNIGNNIGEFYKNNYGVIPSIYFRRIFNYANTFAPYFIPIYFRYVYRNKNNKNYILLDVNTILLNTNRGYIGEKDYWFGPKFNQDISLIKDKTVEYRPPQDMLGELGWDTYALKILWHTENNIKTFYAEEFLNDNIIAEYEGNEYFVSRYIHAQYNLDKKCFIHFDGAICFYNLEEYIEARDSDLNHNIKNEHHIKPIHVKLFRTDGSISQDDWVELTSHFFSQDYLIIEYFEGQFPRDIQDLIDRIRKFK